MIAVVRDECGYTDLTAYCYSISRMGARQISGHTGFTWGESCQFIAVFDRVHLSPTELRGTHERSLGTHQFSPAVLGQQRNVRRYSADSFLRLRGTPRSQSLRPGENRCATYLEVSDVWSDDVAQSSKLVVYRRVHVAVDMLL